VGWPVRPYITYLSRRRPSDTAPSVASVRVGVVGHRFLSVEGQAFAHRACAELFASVASVEPATAISALAEGADTLFADLAIERGWQLEAVQPHEEYLGDFGSAAARTRYVTMRARAQLRIALPYRSRCDAAYEAAMRWVVDRSTILVAIWDGRPSQAVGGTAQTVDYALRSGRRIIHFDVHDQRVAVV
jgi:hypothetical protein